MCSCNVLAIKQRKINFGRQRSVVDNLRLVWVIQKGQAGQVLSCKRGELKRENLFLYHSLRKRIKFLLRTVLLAICCLILQIGFPNGATLIYLLLLLNNLNISAPAPQQLGYICSCSSTNWISAPVPQFNVFAPTYSTLIPPISNPNSFVCSPVQYRVHFCICLLLYAVFPHPQFQRPLSVSNPNFMCLLPSSIFHKLWTLWLQPPFPVWRPLLFSDHLK